MTGAHSVNTSEAPNQPVGGHSCRRSGSSHLVPLDLQRCLTSRVEGRSEGQGAVDYVVALRMFWVEALGLLAAQNMSCIRVNLVAASTSIGAA